MHDKVCVLLLVDGAREDILKKLIAQGKLPNIKKIIENGTFNIGTSTFPTTTGPAHLPFFTGKYAGDCNIPGIRWMEGREKTRSYVSLLANGMMDKDLNKDIKTIYEYTPSACIFEPVSRGASYTLPPIGHFFNHIFNTWIFFEKLGFRFTKRILEKGKYNLIVTLSAAVDELSHRNYCMHPKIMETYEFLDSKIREVIKILEKRYEDYLLFIVSDHGLTDTHTHIDLVNVISSLNFTVRRYPYNINRGQDIFVAESGNSMAHVYFVNEALKQKLESVASKLSGIEGTDVILYKDEDIHVLKDSSEGIIRQKKNKFMYETIKGDPLELEAYSNNWLEENESYKITFNTGYPDSLVQISQIFRSSRAGDIIVTARNGFDLRTVEIPEHKASHGSLTKEHMRIPIISNKEFKPDIFRSGEVFRAIRDYIS